MTRIVDNPDSLAELCRALHDAPWVALDCEFIRDESFFPEPCLIQLATPTRVECIDPKACPDLTPLADILFNPSTLKVFHAARQDLEVFFHLYGRVPAPVFDTQVAAPLLGLAEQIGYADLVRELLGQHLAKGQARTDWRRRPLSSAQLAYAADDVRYLAALYPLMRERLEARGRLAWLHLDFEALVARELYEQAPDQAWQRIKSARQLQGAALSALQLLAAWRERTARTQNRPRGWILRDDALCDIARACPATLAELATLRSVSEAAVRRYGAELLGLIAAARSTPAPAVAPVALTRSLTADEEVLIDLMLAWVRASAVREALNPNLVASRRDLERFVLAPQASHGLRTGWREQLVGAALEELRSGRAGLCYRAGDLTLQPAG